MVRLQIFLVVDHEHTQVNVFMHFPDVQQIKSMINAGNPCSVSVVLPTESKRAGSMWQAVWTGGGVEQP